MKSIWFAATLAVTFLFAIDAFAQGRGPGGPGGGLAGARATGGAGGGCGQGGMQSVSGNMLTGGGSPITPMAAQQMYVRQMQQAYMRQAYAQQQQAYEQEQQELAAKKQRKLAARQQQREAQFARLSAKKPLTAKAPAQVVASKSDNAVSTTSP